MNTDLFLQLNNFYQDNAAAIDQERWDDWMAMFTASSRVRILTANSQWRRSRSRGWAC